MECECGINGEIEFQVNCGSLYSRLRRCVLLARRLGLECLRRRATRTRGRPRPGACIARLLRRRRVSRIGADGRDTVCGVHAARTSTTGWCAARGSTQVGRCARVVRCPRTSRSIAGRRGSSRSRKRSSARRCSLGIAWSCTTEV